MSSHVVCADVMPFLVQYLGRTNLSPSLSTTFPLTVSRRTRRRCRQGEENGAQGPNEDDPAIPSAKFPPRPPDLFIHDDGVKSEKRDGRLLSL